MSFVSSLKILPTNGVGITENVLTVMGKLYRVLKCLLDNCFITQRVVPLMDSGG